MRLDQNSIRVYSFSLFQNAFLNIHFILLKSIKMNKKQKWIYCIFYLTIQ
ncbi:hypothetical protein RV00_GL002182 [Enterococcus devriesei]|uniref:Uncharacterized protein n=1 Tax=Enterococcus devriesei TaxID=319970 RepID=A0A1L8SVR1_9ENTE|nr:hypothetical protein RV00_GL002182 [Enterococcus devriesei]